MGSEERDAVPEHDALGQVLRKIRQSRGHSIREVERKTGISNAYLSQLETGKIEQPSPNFLYRLSDFYSVPYDLLMKAAGYITSDTDTAGPKQRRLSAAALATMDDLTPDEENQVMEYIAFLRSKRKQES